LEKDAGSRFDPDLVKAFIGVLGRTKAVSKTVKT
jgi:HD-GYP domain-containing protein (c-di-GMP phosphodiesterase class II)